MKQKTGTLARRWLSLILSLAMAASLAVTGAWAEEGDSYAISVAVSKEEVQVGDTVTLTATVTKNGETVTDLAAEDLVLWWWTDTWGDHADGLSDAVYSNYDDNSGYSLTADVTLPSEGAYYIAAELQDSSYNRLAITYTTVDVSAASVELTDLPLENGDFENGTTNWTLSGFSSVAADSWASNNTTNTLNLWLSDDEAMYGSAAYTVTLTAGTYQFGFDLSGAEMDSGLSYAVTAGKTTLVSSSETCTTTGWDAWASYVTDEFILTEDTEVTFTLSGTVPAGYWGNLDNLTLKGTGSLIQAEEDDPVDAGVNVDKVKNLSEDFIMGMDISSVMSEFASGVTYQDFDGKTIDNISDFCKFLASCGVTHVRVRVWNDPYDSNGNGYGGGNNDVATAVRIAEGCASAGLKLLVDFHCSDFWTDPGKQQAPKAWADLSLAEKSEALQKFLTDSLQQIKDTGATIDMVQVGNETTSGFIGETSTVNMCTLFSAGSEAIRAFDSSIKVVIHVTNPEKGNMTSWAKTLSDNNVDYDILATSYYPSWHGTLDNLKSQLQTVKSTYGKDVMVAETSYAFTLADTDGHENSVRQGNNDTMMCETQYSFSVQGQTSFLRDIIAAVSEAGGLGVYYWEPAWITVGDTTGLEGEAYTEQVDANKAIWEKYGSGWASSYAAEYDPNDAGAWYGGSAVDNQAMFYSDGSPLDSINVWKYVRSGAVSIYTTVDAVAAPEETIEQGGTYSLPETVTVTYSNGNREEAVTWAQDDVSAVNADQVGTYVVHGTATLSQEINAGAYAGQTTAPVTYTLTVKEANLIPADAAGFEVADDSDFSIDGIGINLPATDDPKEGSHSMHWWSETATTSTVTYQKAIALEPGFYTFEAFAQGYAGDTVTLHILDTAGNVLFSGEPTVLNGWAIWMTPSVDFEVTKTASIQVQIEVAMQDGGWGTVDCLYLHRHEYLPVSAFDVADGQDAYILYRCACGAERTVPLTAQIQGLPDSISLCLGRSVNLVASFTTGELPDGVSCQGTYSSSDTKVLRVSKQGRLNPVRSGSCELTYSVLATVTLSDGSRQTVVVAQQTVPVTVSAKPVNRPQGDPGHRPCPGWPPAKWSSPICQRV
ncbi:MAG: glycosyl hydrolase 53 family protein [Candidatus Onthomonas sp.]